MQANKMLIIGHRGAKGLAPSNTILGFKKALEHDVDIIETDVHVTKDSVPILLHDASLKNPNGKPLGARDHTYAELVAHQPLLARLDESIEFINRQVPFYLEVKEKQPTEAIVAVVTSFLDKGWQPTDFLFASFDFRVLKALHTALPAVPIVVGERWSGTRATHRARRLDTRLLSMQERWLWKGFITPMSRRGWKLHAYTMNNPAKARRFERYGLYAIFTDFPDQFGKTEV